MPTIILGVTGSIAAYKAADLASKLSQAGHDVTCVLTQAACQLVHPNTFLNLTGNKVFTDLWDPDGQTQHIALTDRADVCVIAPATANTIAKIAHGLADDMLTTTLLALRCPLLICPAMNTRMWENPVVQQNIARLKELGHRVMEPGEGALACGHTGAGRLPEPEAIAEEVELLLLLVDGEKTQQIDAVTGLPSPTIVPNPHQIEEPDKQIFLEMVTYVDTPSGEALEEEQRFRTNHFATGGIVVSGRLSPQRYAHVHRAESLAAALERARGSPLAKGKCSIHVFPWTLELAKNFVEGDSGAQKRKETGRPASPPPGGAPTPRASS